MKTRILTLIILLFGMSLHGQDPAHYLPDTVWLKSGKLIPCKIASVDSTQNAITIKYYNENGILAFEPIPFDLIRTFVKGPEINLYDAIAEEKKPLLPDLPKYVKAYLGLGFGVPLSAGLSFTVILKNDWGGSLSCKHTCFDKGLGSGAVPGDQFDEFSLCAVREFPSKTTKNVRFGLEAGPSLVLYEKVERTWRASSWFGGTYYKKETSEHTTMGLSLRAKLGIPVARGFGFEIAAYANINMCRSHAGIEFYINLGRVRDKPKSKTHKN